MGFGVGVVLALFSCALIGADNTRNNESIRIKDIRSFEKRVKALRIFYRKRWDVYDGFPISDPEIEKLIESCSKPFTFFRQQKNKVNKCLKNSTTNQTQMTHILGRFNPKNRRSTPQKRGWSLGSIDSSFFQLLGSLSRQGTYPIRWWTPNPMSKEWWDIPSTWPHVATCMPCSCQWSGIRDALSAWFVIPEQWTVT